MGKLEKLNSDAKNMKGTTDRKPNSRRISGHKFNVYKITIIVTYLINNIYNVNGSVESKNTSKYEEEEIVTQGRSFFENVYKNGTFRTGNSLWDDLLNQCTVNPSVSCLQKNVYGIIDDSLGFNGDVNLTSNVCFKKNKVDVRKYSKEANIIYLTGSAEEDSQRSFSRESGESESDNEIDDKEESETPLEEVTDALYNKGMQFLVTHDMKIKLPEVFFHGTILKISPRALTKTGALVHIDLEPKEETNGNGRLFIIQKIKKQIKKKLFMAAIAIILVVKLIALKLIFVFPLIVGVTTAKKMFLKFVLFLFPALSHIFKLCSWYHQSYHTTKFHKHHHLITHHHHKEPHHGYGPPHSHAADSLVVTHPHPPSPHHTLDYNTQDWELSGPGLGSEYLSQGVSHGIHRNAIANFKPHVDDVHDINAWGLGMPPGPSTLNVGEYAAQPVGNAPNVAPAAHNGPYRSPGAGRPVGPPANPYLRQKKTTPKDPAQTEKEALIRAAALAARVPPSPVRDELLRVSAARLTEANRVQTETELVKQQQQILASQDPETIAADKFYGNLLERVNKILSPLGATETGCRERAICVLYKDPFQHTPYSNLVSNELSKDSSELLPPADSKLALTYYQFVQAARDGQEEKDCLSLYASCNINFKKK